LQGMTGPRGGVYECGGRLPSKPAHTEILNRGGGRIGERNMYDASTVGGGIRDMLPLKKVLLTKSRRSTRKRLISKTVSKH